MNRIQRFKVLGMLGVPLAAIAVLAVFLSFSLLSNTKHAAANHPNAALSFTEHIGSGNTVGNAKGSVTEAIGAPFPVSVSLDSIPGPYKGFAVTVNYTGPIAGQFEAASKGGPKIAGHWPDCAFEAIAPSHAGFENAGCGIGTGAGPSSFTGTVFLTHLTCTAAGAGTVSLKHGASDTNLIDAANKNNTETGPDVINVNCAAATSTFTPTATATQPPIPRVFKTCTSVNVTGVSNICNVFLQRQGTKIPPSTCAAGTSVGTLTEQINIPISSISPKGDRQTLAAFQFEVRYDNKNVCVFLTPGAAWTGNANFVCTVRDDSNSTLKGIAQIGCVTVGKGHKPPATNLTLATITVKPQPVVFSQLRPNQDNGIPVQIMNQGCNLADEQGHAIPIFSCESADLTFRFLEGDIDGPDCKVDVFDTQQVSFRWGAQKGSLLFNSFMDLSPSGQVKGDGKIDIQDVQFVFGRFGSTCAHPWPAQLPVNPKA